MKKIPLLLAFLSLGLAFSAHALTLRPISHPDVVGSPCQGIEYWNASAPDACMLQFTGTDFTLVASTDLYGSLPNVLSINWPQTNWLETSTTAPDYIKNKPSVPTVQSVATTTSGSGTFTWTFPTPYSVVPKVTVTPVGSFSGQSPNVWVTSVSTTSVTIADSVIASALGILSITSNPAMTVNIIATN